MKVSKLFIFFVAILAAVFFALAPVTAGDGEEGGDEHPWQEGESTGSGDTNEDIPPPDPGEYDNPDGSEGLFGTPLWWLGLITGGGNNGGLNAAANPPASGASNQVDVVEAGGVTHQ